MKAFKITLLGACLALAAACTPTTDPSFTSPSQSENWKSSSWDSAGYDQFTSEDNGFRPIRGYIAERSVTGPGHGVVSTGGRTESRQSSTSYQTKPVDNYGASQPSEYKSDRSYSSGAITPPPKSSSKCVNVKGYTKKDGTKVAAHTRGC